MHTYVLKYGIYYNLLLFRYGEANIRLLLLKRELAPLFLRGGGTPQHAGPHEEAPG